MKTILSFRNCLSLFIIASLSLVLAKPVHAAEFVVINRVISWDVNSGDAFWSFQLNANMPQNWLSPNDYYHGTFYTRYEVISVATGEPFGMQFDIFQWTDETHTVEAEQCENVRWLTDGPGTIVTSSSSPATWWKHNGGIDFSRMQDLQSLSMTIWCDDPQAPISKAGAGGDDAGIAWSKRLNWFPVSVRVTVVAVSSGSTFSGWDNYIIDPSRRKPTPAYGIDYVNETTDKVVPATDEYSQYPTMSGAVSGSGEKITVPPGQKLYFRTKAADGLMASEIQIMTVPVRPATPVFVLDKVNHRTTTAVSSEYEHCDFADFSDAVNGNGTQVNISAGITKYFRKKATASSFKSKTQALNESVKLPIAHEFVIFNDYAVFPNNTDTNGFYYFYYNADMPSNWISPENYVWGTIHVRYEIISVNSATPIGLQFGIWQMTPPETGDLHETMSVVKTLTGAGAVGYTSGSPCVSSDFWQLDGNLDYTRMNLTWHFGILPWKVSPVNQQIRQENPSVWAARNTWFPMKVYVTVVAVSSGNTFSGWNNYLGVKPPAPAYTVDYNTSKTIQVIPATDEYSYSPDMSPAFSGSGSALDVIPGQTVYFRTKAQGIHPASDIQRLAIAQRSEKPEFTVDFLNERTVENVDTDIEYSASPDFSGLVTGQGTPVAIIPGTDLYFRRKGSPVPSETFQLVNPSRPAMTGITINYETEKTNEILTASYEYSTNSAFTNAIACTNASISLVPGTDVYIRLKSTGSSFASQATLMDVPARPVMPNVILDFANEVTSSIASSLEWSTGSSMTSPVQGGNVPLEVVPGTDLYIRGKSTISSFCSAVQHLIVPARPIVPVITIDYEAGTTMEPVTETILYSAHADFAQAVYGNGTVITLQPGQHLYFMQPYSSTSFSSGVYHLAVPVQNFIVYTGNDTITSDMFSMYAILANQGAVLTLDDILVTNGIATSMRQGNAFDVYPRSQGYVSIIIPANSVSQNSFASNEVKVFYNKIITGLKDNPDGKCRIYPNPSHDGLITIQIPFNAPFIIGIYSLDGSQIRNISLNNSKIQEINLGDLPKGVYFIKIQSEGHESFEKLILE